MSTKGKTKTKITKRSRTAIDEQRSTTFKVDPSKLIVIGHDTKHKSKAEHPLFQQRALEPVDENLAQNIAMVGFQSVIQVRVDGDKYEVVAGRRRVKAARLANEMREKDADGGEWIPVLVECKVVRGTPLQHVGLMISENANRKDVPPVQMAEDLQGFINLGASEEQAASAGGFKTVAALRQFLKLLDLDIKVQQMVSSGALSVKAATQLAAFSRDEQVVEVAKIQSGEVGSTAADVEARARSKRTGEEVSKAPGRRVINKLLESEDGQRVLSGADGVQIVKWMLGELPANKIKGLVEVIRVVESSRKSEAKK